MTIRVRQLADVGPDQARIKQDDGPSLLFYYIFDDWISSYGIIVQKEYRYGGALDRLVRFIPLASGCHVKTAPNDRTEETNDRPS